MERNVESVRELKRTGDQSKAARALEALRRAYESGGGNSLEYEKECCKAHCTTAEVAGAKRMADGLPFDPMGVVEYPF